MPTAVAELDLAELPSSIGVDTRYSRILLIVTYRGLSLTSIAMDCPPDWVLDSRLLSEIATSNGAWPLWECFIRGQLCHEPVNPPISVIVCTRNRPHMLSRCLSALRHLDYPDFQVVVVDNASFGAETADIVAASGFRYVRELRIGLDWARNRGIREASHEIVSFVDDDATVSTGWLRGMARGFSDPIVMGVTGLIFPAELDTHAQELFERYGGMGKGFQPKYFRLEELTPTDILASQNFGVGANMAFRKKVFETVGMFDTALDVGTPSGGAGDLDMFHRILAAGFTLRYEPSARVRHSHRSDIEGLKRQIRANGQSYGVYLLKAWRDRTVPRSATLCFGANWFLRWLVLRVIKGAIRKERVSLSLSLNELAGALRAPFAYRRTMQWDRRVRQEFT